LTHDLHEVAARSRAALVVIEALAADRPGQIWHYLADAVTDTSALAADIAALRVKLAEERLDRANLAAAGLAAISAYEDDEPDPLSYLRDELAAQVYDLRHGKPR
jgi:hypothetical protein